MRVDTLLQTIEKLAPLFAAAAWDKSGIQAAAFRQDINQVAVMLDPRLSHMERALGDGADFILAHHPLTMQPRFPDRADEYLAALSLLLRNNIWLYSAQTSLDASPLGTAAWLSKELGLQNVQVLEPVPGPAEEPASSDDSADNGRAQAFGFGFTGRLKKAMPYAAFSQMLGKALGKENWNVCGPRPRQVRTVACCPGSGSSMLREALAAEADVYITGDVKYHAALEAEDAGLRIIDVGHFCLEEEMMRRFALVLEKRLPVPVIFYPGKDPLHIERAG